MVRWGLAKRFKYISGRTDSCQMRWSLVLGIYKVYVFWMVWASGGADCSTKRHVGPAFSPSACLIDWARPQTSKSARNHRLHKHGYGYRTTDYIAIGQILHGDADLPLDSLISNITCRFRLSFSVVFQERTELILGVAFCKFANATARLGDNRQSRWCLVYPNTAWQLVDGCVQQSKMISRHLERTFYKLCVRNFEVMSDKWKWWWKYEV